MLYSLYIIVIYTLVVHTAQILPRLNFGKTCLRNSTSYIDLMGELNDFFLVFFEQNDRAISRAHCVSDSEFK